MIFKRALIIETIFVVIVIIPTKLLDFLSLETGQNLFSKYRYFVSLTEGKKFTPNAEVPAI
jgi:hypothetical protein